MRYTCKQDDVLDLICFEYYGNESIVATVLSHNPSLADQGTHLPQGLVIELPNVQMADPVEPQIKLWD